MPIPAISPDEVTLTIPNGSDSSQWVYIGNPTEIGLIVPVITNATITVQVARTIAGAGASTLVNQAGAAILVTAASVGGFAISSNEMGAALGYAFIRVVSSVNQGAERVFYLTRKVSGVDPTA
jgi:hypothetical protein